MEIVNKPMVKLNTNEKEVLRKLKQIEASIDNNLIFNCIESNIKCSECPFKMDEECAIGFLYDTITFIDSAITKE